ncbi:MAG TPA: alpha/beta hydrolase [Azospirillaceae bacterium]|nr:alpha/beta hydrolase [Azospirillaceae bacterium]
MTEDMLLRTAGQPTLLVRRRPARGRGPGRPVLYIHGATFPSALSVAYRFEGRSWMDDLADRGLDVWAFDFPGYGGSDRPAVFDMPAEGGPPVGRATEAAEQIGRVVAHVAEVTGHPRVSLLAHSWGTLVAGLFAAEHPDRVDRLVMFGHVARRDLPDLSPPDAEGRWRLVTVAAQLARFLRDVPAGHPPVLLDPELSAWAPAWLASDPSSAGRSPPSVKIPAGPSADMLAAWSGAPAYDPRRITVPTLIVRGAWDSVTTDADARWLLNGLGGPAADVKVPAATHLMHLERGREGLFEAAGTFLAGCST